MNAESQLMLEVAVGLVLTVGSLLALLFGCSDSAALRVPSLVISSAATGVCLTRWLVPASVWPQVSYLRMGDDGGILLHLDSRWLFALPFALGAIGVLRWVRRCGASRKAPSGTAARLEIPGRTS